MLNAATAVNAGGAISFSDEALEHARIIIPHYPVVETSPFSHHNERLIHESAGFLAQPQLSMESDFATVPSLPSHSMLFPTQQQHHHHYGSGVVLNRDHDPNSSKSGPIRLQEVDQRAVSPTESTGRKKKTRERMNMAQKTILEEAFQQTRYPDVAEMTNMAQRIDAPFHRVRNWYNNRRAKLSRDRRVLAKHDAAFKEADGHALRTSIAANFTQVANPAGLDDNCSDSSIHRNLKLLQQQQQKGSNSTTNGDSSDISSQNRTGDTLPPVINRRAPSLTPAVSSPVPSGLSWLITASSESRGDCALSRVVHSLAEYDAKSVAHETHSLLVRVRDHSNDATTASSSFSLRAKDGEDEFLTTAQCCSLLQALVTKIDMFTDYSVFPRGLLVLAAVTSSFSTACGFLSDSLDCKAGFAHFLCQRLVSATLRVKISELEQSEINHIINIFREFGYATKSFNADIEAINALPHLVLNPWPKDDDDSLLSRILQGHFNAPCASEAFLPHLECEDVVWARLNVLKSLFRINEVKLLCRFYAFCSSKGNKRFFDRYVMLLFHERSFDELVEALIHFCTNIHHNNPKLPVELLSSFLSRLRHHGAISHAEHLCDFFTQFLGHGKERSLSSNA